MTAEGSVQERNSRLGRRVVIVGGGISGLCTAFFLSRKATQEHLSLKITVLEASDRWGGAVRTLTHGDLQMEAGADAVYAGSGDTADLCRELGLQEDLIEAAPCFRNFFGMKNKKLVPVGGPQDSFLGGLRFLADSRGGVAAKCRMLCEPFIPRRKETGDESVASFIRRRLGKGFYRTVVKPLIQGVYMMDPERASLEAMFPGFKQAEHIYGSLAASFLSKVTEKKEKGAGEFLTLKHGLEGWVQAMVRELGACDDSSSGLSERDGVVWSPACEDGASRPRERAGIGGGLACELRRSAPVRKCAYHANAGWEISTQDGAVLRADSLVLAMNACDASRLLSAAVPELSAELSSLRYDSIAAVNLIYRIEDVPAQGLNPGFLVAMDNERYPFSSLKWIGKTRDGKHLLLRAFLSETMRPELFNQSDETLKPMILACLKDLFGIQAKPRFIHVERYPSALPQYETGHLECVARIEAKVRQSPGLYLAGNGFRGFGITDCVRQARNVASEIFASLGNHS